MILLDLGDPGLEDVFFRIQIRIMDSLRIRRGILSESVRGGFSQDPKAIISKFIDGSQDLENYPRRGFFSGFNVRSIQDNLRILSGSGERSFLESGEETYQDAEKYSFMVCIEILSQNSKNDSKQDPEKDSFRIDIGFSFGKGSYKDFEKDT